VQNLKNKIICTILVALVSTLQANASPTYFPYCFETEAEAQAKKDRYSYAVKQNAEKTKKEAQTIEFLKRDDVKLSDIEAILGGPTTKKVSSTNKTDYKWEITYYGSPRTSKVYYDKVRGYCVDAKLGGVKVVTFTWRSLGNNSSYGVLRRHDFYM